MTPGLVSVTFRPLSAERIVELCVENGLRGIEWGGDVHVQHGNLAVAEEVRELTLRSGVCVVAYGSYYRIAASDGPSFSDVLETAVVLGAPVIRVWAGEMGSADVDPAYRARVASDALRCADLAARRGVGIAYESHEGTLTDTLESTLQLLSETEHPSIRTLWQPPHGKPLEFCKEWLHAVVPRLAHIHAFHWWPDSTARRPLAEGVGRWAVYLDLLRSEGWDGPVLLEFVKDDEPANLCADAATLCSLCAG